VEFGDWRYDDNRSGWDPTWFRLTNYGVFHCYTMVRGPDDQTQLEGRSADPSFFIELGTIRIGNGETELWALQRGGRPGSSYLLLARKPTPGIIRTFDVLQRACPPDRIRKGPQLDILLTRYCAINSPQELTQLARQMVERPPLGRLTFVGPAGGEK
jgi:hypothetical protein